MSIFGYDEVDGIAWCSTHDDFAIEGYDWSVVCHDAWMSGVMDDEDEAARVAEGVRRRWATRMSCALAGVQARMLLRMAILF